MQGPVTGHTNGDALFFGRLADFGDAGDEQILGFEQWVFRCAARDGHAEFRGNLAIIQAAANDAAIGVNRTVLPAGPAITARQNVAMSRCENSLAGLQVFNAQQKLERFDRWVRIQVCRLLVC